jgi:hypothetical protein
VRPRALVQTILAEAGSFVENARAGSFVMRQVINPDDVMTWAEFNSILNYSGAPRNLVRDGLNRIAGATTMQVVEGVREGSTLQMESLTPYSEHMASIAGELSTALGGEKVDVNVYLAPSAEHTAFGLHHDTVDVFVLQIAGQKRWRIYEPRIESPVWVMKQHRYDMDHVEPILDLVLSQGDVLFLRRGDPHAVACVGQSPSLHVNLRIFPTTGQSLMDWLVQEAVEEVWMRESIPFDVDKLSHSGERIEWAEGVRTRFSAWLAAKTADEMIDGFLNHRAASAGIPGVLSLPTRSGAPKGPLAASESVQLSHPMLGARICDTKLYTLGKEMGIPSDLVPVVEALLRAPSASFSIGSLARTHDVNVVRVGAVLSELVAEGVLRLVSGTLVNDGRDQRGPRVESGRLGHGPSVTTSKAL